MKRCDRPVYALYDVVYKIGLFYEPSPSGRVVRLVRQEKMSEGFASVRFCAEPRARAPPRDTNRPDGCDDGVWRQRPYRGQAMSRFVNVSTGLG